MTSYKTSTENSNQISHLADQVAEDAVQNFLNTFSLETLDSLPKNFVEEAKASLYHQLRESINSRLQWIHQDFCLEKAKVEKQHDRAKAPPQAEQQKKAPTAQNRRRRRRSSNLSQQDHQAWWAQLREEVKQNTDEKGIRRRRKARHKVDT